MPQIFNGTFREAGLPTNDSGCISLDEPVKGNTRARGRFLGRKTEHSTCQAIVIESAEV
jgi:hypothetical protein